MKMNMNNEIGKLFEAAAYAQPGFDTRYKPREPEYIFLLKKWLADPKAFGQIANPEDYVEGSGVWFVKALKLWYAKNKRPPTHDEFHRLTTSLLTKGLPRYLLTDLMDLIDKVVPHGHDESGQDVVTESDAPVAWQHADGSCQCHRCAKRRYGNRLMNPKTIGLHPVYDEEGELDEAQVGKLVCRTCKKALGKMSEAQNPTKKPVTKNARKKLKEGMDVFVAKTGTGKYFVHAKDERGAKEIASSKSKTPVQSVSRASDSDVWKNYPLLNSDIEEANEPRMMGHDMSSWRNAKRNPKDSLESIQSELFDDDLIMAINAANEEFAHGLGGVNYPNNYRDRHSVVDVLKDFAREWYRGEKNKYPGISLEDLVGYPLIKYITNIREANEPPKDEDDLDLDDILDGDEETSTPSDETSDEVKGNPDDDGEAGDHASWTPKKGMPGIGMTLSLQKESEDGYRWKLEMIDRGIPFEAAIDGEVDISAEDKLSSIVIEYKKFQAKVENILSGFSN